MKVDVVIIGGGMVGAVTALALAKADFSVAVVEANQQDPAAEVNLLVGARRHGFNAINSRPSIRRVFMRVALGVMQ